MATPVALLDASVIVPAPLYDTLLQAAESRMYEPRWSDAILSEVERTLVVDLFRTPEQAARRMAAMRQAFPRATVGRYEPLIAQMTNHPKDRHVLAAAVFADADLLVTGNLRDFPDSALLPYDIQALSPDDFLLLLDRSTESRMIEVLHRQAANLHRPPLDMDALLDRLALQAPRFAERMRAKR